MAKQLTITAPVRDALTNYTGTLISAESFAVLSDIIEKISNNKEELTDGMRQAATQYANDWDELVVKRLDDRMAHLTALNDFFEQTRPNYYTIQSYTEDSVYNIHKVRMFPAVISMLRANDNKAWHNFADRLEKIADTIEDLGNEERETPQREDYFDTDERLMGYDDRIIAQKQYELDVAKYQRVIFKKQMAIRVKFVEVLKAMLKDDDIKQMLACVREQRRKVHSAKSVVHEKSALVKLAINFGGTDLLKALQDLHDFQKKL